MWMICALIMQVWGLEKVGMCGMRIENGMDAMGK